MKRLELNMLELATSRYPWFSIGYIDLYRRILERDPIGAESYLKKAALRIYSRDKLFVYCNENSTSDKISEPLIENIEAAKVIEQNRLVTEIAHPSEVKQSVSRVVVEQRVDREEPLLEFGKSISHKGEKSDKIVIGADYFSSEDFNDVELKSDDPLDSYISENPSLLKSSFIEAAKEREAEQGDDSGVREGLVEEIACYSETLALIYADQGYYKEAEEVFAKLILLNPEKKSYFASLIEEIKRKNS